MGCDPKLWSPTAVYKATQLFVSETCADLALAYLLVILQPKIRHDIQVNKSLHIMLRQSLKKASYKGDLFYKGLILPLYTSCNSSLKETTIISSVLKTIRLPVVYSISALLLIMKMKHHQATPLFICSILAKKYHLPYRVIDSLVEYFIDIVTNNRKLPHFWFKV